MNQFVVHKGTISKVGKSHDCGEDFTPSIALSIAGTLGESSGMPLEVSVEVEIYSTNRRCVQLIIN